MGDMTLEKFNFNPKTDLIFDIKVHESCKSCKRYGLTGCCPPKIGSFDYYKKLLPKYKHGLLLVLKFKINDNKDWKLLGRQSSLELHRELLKERDKIFNEGNYFSIILGGGSCKWCEKCSIPCKFPQYRVIPIEATGINVVKTIKKFGYKLDFPVKDSFYRIGMILWG
jgi:predicted metal-binding protein